MGVLVSRGADAPLAIIPVSNSAAETRLVVTNASAPNVNLQGSFNLETWFPLQSTAPVQGTASFVLTNREPVSTWFLRAVAAPPPVIVNVGAQADASQSVAGLIIPETGGRLEITDAQGVRYQLTIGTNLVSEPTVIRMTVITNFTDMPLTNRFRAAVSLQPDGLEFRGAAELKIRFPNPIPQSQMVGFGFDGSGDGFHLRPWEPTTNEVSLAVSHFSGAGVAAQPFPVTASPLQNYERAYAYTRDVIREADHWAGSRYRESWQRRDNGTMTDEEASAMRRSARNLRGVYIYRNAIEPLLAAAEQDCAIGGVVLQRIAQLTAESEYLANSELYNQQVRKAALAIRCNCARYYLEGCEKNPNSSGNSATSGLNEILDRSALITGLIDDPNCDLGSDFDILKRLARAPCHKPWEGSVRYSHIYVSSLATTEPGASFQYLETHREEVGFEGRLTSLIEEDGDVLDTGAWQSWTFKMAGKLSGNRRDEARTTTIEPGWTLTETDVTQGSSSRAAVGTLMIRFDDGELSSLSAESGLDIKYPYPLQRITQQDVECRLANTKECPKPRGPETQSAGNETPSLGLAASKGPRMVIGWQKNGSLKAVYTWRTAEEQPEPRRRPPAWQRARGRTKPPRGQRPTPSAAGG
ncbi:MAG: hypothetical protein ACKO3N_07785, partial [Verrucomicrobiota bacterium]